MINLRYILPVLGLLAVTPAVSNAQSTAFCETQYQIQVQYENWTSGRTHWLTEYTTDDFAEAELMLELFESALETGDLEDILNVGWSYIIRDIQLVPKTTCHYPQFQQLFPSRNWTLRNYQIRKP